MRDCGLFIFCLMYIDSFDLHSLMTKCDFTLCVGVCPYCMLLTCLSF